MLLRKFLMGLMLAFAPALAMAQTVVSAPTNWTWGEAQVRTQPSLMMGLDSGTGLPCVIASTSTCSVPVSDGGSAFVNITTATTTLVKTGAGTFHKLCINTYAASGVVVIYDGVDNSGAPVATITNPATLLAEGPNCAVYDVSFATGLTVVTTGTQDITVTYR